MLSVFMVECFHKVVVDYHFVIECFCLLLFDFFSWLRVHNPAYFVKTTPILPTPYFFNFVTQPSPSLFFFLSCLFRWIGDCSTFSVLFYLMDLRKIIPERACHVFYATRCPVIHILFFTNTLIWYRTHTKIHSTYRG